MRDRPLEPRLLDIFRLYIALRVGFLAMSAVVYLAEGGQPFTLTTAPQVTLFLVDIAFLVVFLYWPWLQRHLGRLYLPLALTVASVIPISEADFLYEIFGGWSAARLWVLFPFLSVPLILTAWQYGSHEVTLYCFATAALELVLMILSPRYAGMSFLSEAAMILTRTALFMLIGHIISLIMAVQRAQREELADANQRLMQYAATLEQLTISRERNRLARELHDTLAHTLSGLAVQLDAILALWDAAPQRARHMLAQALDNTRGGLDETRRALQDLRATPLEDLGLAMALANLAKEATARSGLELRLDVGEIAAELPAAMGQCFYRVAQEAIENVVRHAEAQHLSVQLQQHEDSLHLTVADDGQGFAPSSAPAQRQYGLQGMRERAELVGAQLEVESNPGHGTTIRLHASLDQRAGDAIASDSGVTP